MAQLRVTSRPHPSVADAAVMSASHTGDGGKPAWPPRSPDHCSGAPARPERGLERKAPGLAWPWARS